MASALEAKIIPSNVCRDESKSRRDMERRNNLIQLISFVLAQAFPSLLRLPLSPLMEISKSLLWFCTIRHSTGSNGGNAFFYVVSFRYFFPDADNGSDSLGNNANDGENSAGGVTSAAALMELTKKS